MAKKNKIVDVNGDDFVEQAKKVTGLKPFGNLVLVERLNESELTGPSLLITTVEDKPSNQGYVVAIGPMVNKDYGLAVGDRVLLQGSFVPAPNYDDHPRERNLLLPDMIKAILSE